MGLPGGKGAEGRKVEPTLGQGLGESLQSADFGA